MAFDNYLPTSDDILNQSRDNMFRQQLREPDIGLDEQSALGGLQDIYVDDNRTPTIITTDTNDYEYNYSPAVEAENARNLLVQEEAKNRLLTEDIGSFGGAVKGYSATKGYTSTSGSGFGKSAYGYGGVKTGQSSQKGSGPYGFQPQMWNALQAAFSDMKAAGVGVPRITDGFRSYGLQVKTKAAKGNLAATPGNSVHGLGYAADLGLNSKQQKWLEANGKKYGLARLPSESWHWQLMPQYIKGAPKPSGAIAMPNVAAKKVAKKRAVAKVGTVAKTQGTAADTRYRRVM